MRTLIGGKSTTWNLKSCWSYISQGFKTNNVTPSNSFQSEFFWCHVALASYRWWRAWTPPCPWSWDRSPSCPEWGLRRWKPHREAVRVALIRTGAGSHFASRRTYLLIDIATITGCHPERRTSLVWGFCRATTAHSGIRARKTRHTSGGRYHTSVGQQQVWGEILQTRWLNYLQPQVMRKNGAQWKQSAHAGPQDVAVWCARHTPDGLSARQNMGFAALLCLVIEEGLRVLSKHILTHNSLKVAFFLPQETFNSPQIYWRNCFIRIGTAGN